MDIGKHIINTVKFYLDLTKTQLQNKQYIANIVFDVLLDKNATNFLLKHSNLFYDVKYKCKEFLNNKRTLPWFHEKMKFYDNIISKLELELLNNT